MTITTGVQAASATPATDAYNLLATALTAAGWFEETTRTYTARAMATTAACKVWVSSASSPNTLTSGNYTGTIVIFELDDTNARLRFRVCEQFNSSIATSTIGTGLAVDTTADTITKIGHGLTTDDTVYLENLVTSTGLTMKAPYFVLASGLTADVFKVGATKGGSAINIGGSNGTVDVYKSCNNCKWQPWGGVSSGSITPTANYAVVDTYYTPAGDQAPTASTVAGYVSIDCSAQGFAYMLGARTEQVLYANNSGGLHHWVYFGQANYTMLAESGGSPMVFLACKQLAAGSDGSWTVAASTSQGNVRTSKEPLTTISTTGAFCFHTAMTVTTVGSSGGQTGAPHKWLTGVAMFPAYIAGVSGGAPASTRSHLMAMTGFYLFNPTNSAVTNIAMGDTLTVGGSTYYILGATGIATTSTSDYGIAVDGSIF